MGRMDRQIPSSTLAALRGILISSLARENLGPYELTLKQQLRRRQAATKQPCPGTVRRPRSGLRSLARGTSFAGRNGPGCERLMRFVGKSQDFPWD